MINIFTYEKKIYLFLRLTRDIFKQVCVGAKSKDQCTIALQFASKAFSGKIPEELESLLRNASVIASGEKADSRQNQDKYEKSQDLEVEISFLVGATSDRYLRYEIFECELAFLTKRCIHFSFIGCQLSKGKVELAQEAWGMLQTYFPRVAQENLERFVASLCDAGIDFAIL